MKPTWIVLADEGRARILAQERRGADLQDVEELTDAAAHADEADLQRDAHGRRAHGGTGQVSSITTSAGADKLEQEADLFARRVAEYLAQALQKEHYGALHIAAAPRFLGRLRQHLSPQVQQTVAQEINKDLLQFKGRDLAQRIFGEEPAHDSSGGRNSGHPGTDATRGVGA
ncbi:host attachment protein [Azohydromonas caseinilytica]|uniref:Host attachment protein n=1 Tax=Azohydromonas caseinilytica TaxID=2728836 RepID=A0A848F2X3_9BURK|nr:host attachment protein [Azohydromonas caseinilytica]NML13378.1 host attachment protein [Azohydromonas caseinilytica]